MKWLALSVAVIVAGMLWLHHRGAKLGDLMPEAGDAVTPDLSDPISALYASGQSYWIPDSAMRILPQSDENLSPAGTGGQVQMPYDIISTFR